MDVRTFRWYVDSVDREGEATSCDLTFTGDDVGVEGPLNEAKRLMSLAQATGVSSVSRKGERHSNDAVRARSSASACLLHKLLHSSAHCIY